ncbi:MAG: epoxyqueuosine reductase QueG/putative sterol carrier protein [Hyphomicrobiaceae bacterium]|jgi:epoxyqueuosine reductase QueG/putative sterol carrier protein
MASSTLNKNQRAVAQPSRVAQPSTLANKGTVPAVDAVGPATPRGHRNSNTDWDFPFSSPGRFKQKGIKPNSERRMPFGDMQAYDNVTIEPRFVASPVGWDTLKASLLEFVDDVGLVSIDHPALAHEVDEIRYVYPHARSLIVMIGEENKPSLQSRYLPTANHELYQCEERLFSWGSKTLALLKGFGGEGLTTTVGWPQEVSQRWSDKIWPLSHKLAAQAAGLGVIGTSRNFLHERFGAYCLIDTIVTNLEFAPEEYAARPTMDWNPCLSCNLCVVSCPTDAIRSDGEFDFFACYNHTYRDSIPGFLDIMRDAAEGKPKRFEKRWSDAEVAAMWQSLAFKVEYRCFNCVATCPAEIHEAFHAEKSERLRYKEEHVRPLTHTRRTVEEQLVIDTPTVREELDIPPGQWRTPHDPTRPGQAGTRLVQLQRIRVSNIDSMMRMMPMYFRYKEAKGIDVTFQFDLSGEGGGQWAMRVVDQRCSVTPGPAEAPDIRIACPGTTLLGIHRGEINPVVELLRGRIKLKGRKELFLLMPRLFPVASPEGIGAKAIWYARRTWRRWQSNSAKPVS